MTKYELLVDCDFIDSSSKIVEHKSFTFYGSYPVELLRKFEKLKSNHSPYWYFNVVLRKVENIRYFTLSEISAKHHNDKEYIFICSFDSNGTNCQLGENNV